MVKSGYDKKMKYFSATVKIHPEFLKQQSDTDVAHNVAHNKREERQQKILQLIKSNPSISQETIAMNLGVTRRTINRDLEKLRKIHNIEWSGSSRSGFWIIEK